MRHHWLAIYPLNNNAWEQLPHRISGNIIPALTWRPEMVWAERINKLVCLSFSSNSKLFGISEPYFQSLNSTCMVSGLPTVERFAGSANTHLPEVIDRLIYEHSPQELFNKLGGTWSIAHAADEQLTVFSDFSGYASCFFAKTADYFVVGNTAPLVAAVINAKYNYSVLSWLFSTTMILGGDSIFEGVKKLEPGSFLQCNPSGYHQVKAFRNNFFTPPAVSNEFEQAIFARETVDTLQSRVAWYLERKIPLLSHLTGGKDSRAILGLLLGSGQIENLDFIQTMGNDDNGDVMVARDIANRLGLQHKHKVQPGSKKKLELDVLGRPKLPDGGSGFMKNVYYTAFKYSGQLTPFDGEVKPSGGSPKFATLMGGGGEIYRQKSYHNFTEEDSVFSQFLNWSYKYNKLGILTDDAIEMQVNFLRSEARKLLEMGVKNHQAKFYIDHRLSNWGHGHLAHGPGNAIPVLLDVDLCRLMFTGEDMGENIHFDIIYNSCPDLLKIPFLNQRWLGSTSEKAKQLGVDLEPVKVETAKDFPWQFSLYDNYRNELIDLVLDRLDDNYKDYVSVDRLIKLKENESVGYNSADIKMLTGLVMSVLHFSDDGGRVSDPDCAQQSGVQFFGNYIKSKIVESVYKKGLVSYFGSDEFKKLSMNFGG